MTVKTPIESILALAASVFDAYSVVLFEAPHEGRSQIIAAYTQGEHINQDAVIAPGRGIVGWILRNNAPLVMNSLESSQTSLGYYQEDWLPEIGSFLGCPLPEGGVLCVDSLLRHAFPQEKQNLIAVFAEIVAQVLTMDGQNSGSDSGGAFLMALDRLAELRRRYSGWKNYIAQLLAILVENSGFEYAAFSSRPEGSPKYIVEGETPRLLLKDGKPMDLCLAAFYRGPASYTGEDMAEIFCHGSQAVVAGALEHAFAQGARVEGDLGIVVAPRHGPG